MKSWCKGLVMDRDHVERAYKQWLESCAGHKNAWRVPIEHGSADGLIDEIAREIDGRCLRLRPIVHREHVERSNGKVRMLGVESVKQQVLDYAIVLAMQPMLSAKLGYWQVAGVRGKGQKACGRALRKWVREGGYHVKLDVRKCYPSIRHDVVRRIVRKYVRSTDVIYCVDAVLDTYTIGGLEIGSYFSMQMSNLVLSFAYHHLEGLHKVRRGKSVPLVTHQIWHLDDALLISPDKRNLKAAVRSVIRYMRDELGLEVKPWKIARTSDREPLDLGGFVARMRRLTLRSSIFLGAARAFRRFANRNTLRLAQRAVAYWGWFKHSDSDRYIKENDIRRLHRIARRVISRAGKAEQWTSALKALPS